MPAPRWVLGILSAAIAIGGALALQVQFHLPLAASFGILLVLLFGLRVAFALLTGELRR